MPQKAFRMHEFNQQRKRNRSFGKLAEIVKHPSSIELKDSFQQLSVKRQPDKKEIEFLVNIFSQPIANTQINMAVSLQTFKID